MTALLFPGQGTLRVGMGQALRVGFPEIVDGVIAQACAHRADLPELLRHGPAERLAHTSKAQPAVTTVNLCALAVLHTCGIQYDVVAGHSVGLLSALVAADVLDSDAALRLASARGALMGARPPGAMVSVLGIEPALAEEIAWQASEETGLTVVVALVNGPETVVFSGNVRAVDRAVTAAAHDGVRVTPLAVSHAFHSPLMLPALSEWRLIVEAQKLRPASVPVIADTSGEPLTAVADLHELLVEQMVTTVRWDRVCERLQTTGEWDCVEVGDSKALWALARPYPDLSVTSMAQPHTLTHLRRHHRLPPPRAFAPPSAARSA
jgi:[acyl-carrier-protein] S-malonyltransferase